MATNVQARIAEIRIAMENLKGYGEPDLAAGLEEWLEEQEPKTVVLHNVGVGGSAYKYRSISSISGNGVTAEVIGIWLQPGDCLHWNDGGASHTVAESAARITAAARAVWPDFDCPGAEPRLRPTVTLHGVNNGMPYDFASIERLDKWTGCTRVEGREVDGAYSYRLVSETRGEITAAARKVWGSDCSFPGADPPVVVLKQFWGSGSVALDRIDYLGEPGESHVQGLIRCRGHRVGSQASYHLGTQLRGPLSDIRAAAAAAGVPCPPEPNPLAEGLVGAWVTGHHHQSAPCYWGGAATFSFVDPQVAKLKERAAELEAEVANMKEAYDGRNKEVRKIVAAKNKAQERITELEAERFELLDERGNLKSRLGGCRTRNTDLQSELNAALRNHDAYVVQAVAEKEALQARINAEVWAQTRSPEWQVETERADNAEAKCATLQSRLAARDLHGGMRVSRLSQSPRGHAVIRIAIPHSAIEVAISPNNGMSKHYDIIDGLFEAAKNTTLTIEHILRWEEQR